MILIHKNCGGEIKSRVVTKDGRELIPTADYGFCSKCEKRMYPLLTADGGMSALWNPEIEMKIIEIKGA